MRPAKHPPCTAPGSTEKLRTTGQPHQLVSLYANPCKMNYPSELPEQSIQLSPNLFPCSFGSVSSSSLWHTVRQPHQHLCWWRRSAAGAESSKGQWSSLTLLRPCLWSSVWLHPHAAQPPFVVATKIPAVLGWFLFPSGCSGDVLVLESQAVLWK